MPKHPPLTVLAALADVAWPILITRFSPDCCIAATRIGIRVLAAFGVAGRPQLVGAMAANAAYMRWVGLARGGDPPSNARVVVIDEDSPTGFPAHLVIVGRTVGVTYLLDLSAPQFHRPQKKIFVPTPLLVTHEEGCKRADQIPLAVSLSGGGGLMYRELAKSPDYTSAPDWRIRPQHLEDFNEVCSEMVERVKKVLSRG